jgi:hypothetical protein
MMTMAEIRETHAKLYGEYIDQRQKILQAPAEFEHRAAALLNEMRRVSALVTSVEDYDWLRSAVDKWRAVYVFTLNVPRNISLQPPTQTLLPPIGRKEDTFFSEAVLNRWVRNLAFEGAKRRVVCRLQAMAPEELLKKMPSTKEEEEQDWRAAGIQLAYEVIEGRIALNRIRPESYWRIMQVWLEDVKRVKAFYVWIDRGAAMETPRRTRENYSEACRLIGARLLGGTKLDPREFTAVSDYLEARYLSNGKVDLEKCTPLIGAKAHRLWETTGETDCDKNWQRATNYVCEFYGHIIPAIVAGDPDAHARVAGEMLEAVEGPDQMVNVFEMAIAVSFLPASESNVGEKQELGSEKKRAVGVPAA